MSDRHAIYLALAGCALGSAILLLEPSATDEAAITGFLARDDIVPATHRERPARVAELLATARDRPLLSATRRPQLAEGNTSANSELADTRLTGIIVEAGRRLAIFAVPDAKPLELTEGETLGGWQIENIGLREVSLNGPTGTKTLQLRADPNPKAPPAAAQQTEVSAPARTRRGVAAEAPPGVAAAAKPTPGAEPRHAAERRPRAQTSQPR